MLGVNGSFEVGNVMVRAENNRGHPPEFWAESATKTILGTASDHLGPDVEEQARVFRDRLKGEIYRCILGALRSDRQTIAGALRRDGHDVMADQLLQYKVDG